MGAAGGNLLAKEERANKNIEILRIYRYKYTAHAALEVPRSNIIR
jgi:hypothetical protein